MELMEKVSYLKGLVDMAEFDPSSKETKVLNAMLEVLDEMAKTVQSLTEANAQMCDVIESIDEDLSQVEEDLYGDEDEDEEDEDELYYEITCPKCGETVCVDEDTLVSEDLACPNCGTEFEVEFDEDCDCGEECDGCCDKDE